MGRRRTAAAARRRSHCRHADANGNCSVSGHSGYGSRAAHARRRAARRGATACRIASGATFAGIPLALRHGDVRLIGARLRLPALRERRAPRRQHAQCDDRLQCCFHDMFPLREKPKTFALFAALFEHVSGYHGRGPLLCGKYAGTRAKASSATCPRTMILQCYPRLRIGPSSPAPRCGRGARRIRRGRGAHERVRLRR